MRVNRLIAPVLVATGFLFGSASPGHAEPFRIFYFVWVGYTPLLVAEEKGFFEEQGIEVEFIDVKVHTAAFASLFEGQVDAITAVVQDTPAYSGPDQEPLVCALPLDEDQGGTGIVAASEIAFTADLEGKSIAALRGGSIQQFYLNVVLDEVGLSEADVEIADLSAEDAAEAFLLGEVDAAVTYEPFLARALKADHGHLLVDDSQHPGLVVDCLLTTRATFQHKKDQFQAVATAWDAAVRFSRAHPAEFIDIVARAMNEKPEAIAEMLGRIRLYDRDASQAYLGTPDDPGQVYETMQHAMDIWTEHGLLTFPLAPGDLIVHGIWGE